MNYDILISFIHQFGYAALFFSLWLGIVGMPVPDEVIVMTGGMVSALHILKPLPALFLTYSGVVSGLTLGYVVGKKAGVPALNRLIQKKKAEKFLTKSHEIVARFGSYALCVSYFFPVVRHLIPYLVGISNMPFPRYALFSYITGLIWTSMFFTLGYFMGDHVEQIGSAVHTYGWYILVGSTVLGLVYWLAHRIRIRFLAD
ncbi:DedA family protein [Effusibacillus dendaii]|uniref:Alkaline phosphatase n=1 Tax=Effusibacillus dendaii TaxID=2743772 RepID=A0A7I8DDX1_9BACL|nr:DedA family protein [Effusibacillus dendaii]BCJ88314.1 alkaline phosphatase [Effusibacillus dendaii]